MDATADSIVALGVVGPLYEEIALERRGSGTTVTGRVRSPARQPDVWPLVAAEGELRLETLLAQTTEPGDTHPALGERLVGLGATPRIPAPPDRTAGDLWLATHMAAIAARLDEQWAAAQGDGWRRHRDERREGRERLSVLERITAPTPAQLYEKARLVELLDGVAAALPLYEAAAALAMMAPRWRWDASCSSATTIAVLR